MVKQTLLTTSLCVGSRPPARRQARGPSPDGHDSHGLNASELPQRPTGPLAPRKAMTQRADDCAVSGAVPAHQALRRATRSKRPAGGLLKPTTGLGLELLDIRVGTPRVMTRRISSPALGTIGMPHDVAHGCAEAPQAPWACSRTSSLGPRRAPTRRTRCHPRSDGDSDGPAVSNRGLRPLTGP